LAANEDGVKDGSAITGLRMTYEEPVLFANDGWAYCVFHAVVVDGSTAVVEVCAEVLPVVECIVAGFA